MKRYDLLIILMEPFERSVMLFPAHAKFSSYAPTLLLFGLILVHGPIAAQNPSPQTQSPASKKPVRHDSVEVTAHLSPEEVEDGKLNDAYDPIAQLQLKGICTTEIIQRYQSEVIPLAERSTVEVPKNKFFFSPTATSGIAISNNRNSRKPKPPSRRFCSMLPFGPAPTTPPTPSISGRSPPRRWASNIGQRPNNRYLNPFLCLTRRLPPEKSPTPPCMRN